MCISQFKLPLPPPPRHLELSAGEFNISVVLKKVLTSLAPRAMYFLKSQGARDGAVVRELPPMWPRFRSLRRRHMWVAFVVGSPRCSERFSLGTRVFPSPQKPLLPNSSASRNQVGKELLCGCRTSKSL